MGVFLFFLRFLYFLLSVSSWFGLDMALVSVLLEILQRLTITDVLTAKRVDDVHSTCLGSGNCWGFGGMGMEA